MLRTKSPSRNQMARAETTVPSTAAPTAAPPKATAPEPTQKTQLMEWIEKRRKVLTYALGGVFAVGVIGWLYTVSNRNKAAVASDALDAAQSAFDSGNLPG